MKTISVCRYCGSPRVYCDAFVGINDETDVHTYDHEECFDCEGETRTIAATVPDDFDMESGRVDVPKVPA
jgi:hypothetical protein